jgi:hypothetical protein
MTNSCTICAHKIVCIYYEHQLKTKEMFGCGDDAELFNQRVASICTFYDLKTIGKCGVKFDLCGPNKISVIKCIRQYTNLGLKESKDLAESAPSIISGYGKENMERMANALRIEGATAYFCEGNCDNCTDRFKCLTT